MSAATLAVLATWAVIAVVCLAVGTVAVQVLATVRARTATAGAPLPVRRPRPPDDDVADSCERAFAKTAWTRLGGGH